MNSTPVTSFYPQSLHHFGYIDHVNEAQLLSEVLHIIDQMLNNPAFPHYKQDVLKVLEQRYSDRVDYCKSLVDIFCSTNHLKQLIEGDLRL